MPPPTHTHTQSQFKFASMLTALYCVTMIHQLFQGRACKNTIWSNFEITKCYGYGEYKVKVIRI